MAFQNNQHSHLLPAIAFLLSIIWFVTAQYSLHYACDNDKNSSLKKFVFRNTSLDVKTRDKNLVNMMTLQERRGLFIFKPLLLIDRIAYVKGLQEIKDGDEDRLGIQYGMKSNIDERRGLFIFKPLLLIDRIAYVKGLQEIKDGDEDRLGIQYGMKSNIDV
ncbi:hypothetical protein L2E82_37101 [Cichorium intybus]|uniref:Uncharacterized protein n=1 Tax=Cichorium intybus TaxID=13427 RepID=A0ACB9ACY3_CICIN|nr:hypothetical protein L2E82_37101 [Cichorium intybus]